MVRIDISKPPPPSPPALEIAATKKDKIPATRNRTVWSDACASSVGFGSGVSRTGRVIGLAWLVNKVVEMMRMMARRNRKFGNL